MVRAQIILTESQYDQLKQKSQMEKRSVSSIVREGVDKVLVKKKRFTGKNLLEMAKDAKPYPNAPKDLATNDDYLYKLP